jgi:hypothetical protein
VANPPVPTQSLRSEVLSSEFQQWKSFADNQDESQNRQHKQSGAYGIKDCIHSSIVIASRGQVLVRSLRRTREFLINVRVDVKHYFSDFSDKSDYFYCHAYPQSLAIGTRSARGCLARTRIGGHDKFLSVGIGFVLCSLLVLWGLRGEVPLS